MEPTNPVDRDRQWACPLPEKLFNGQGGVARRLEVRPPIFGEGATAWWEFQNILHGSPGVLTILHSQIPMEGYLILREDPRGELMASLSFERSDFGDEDGPIDNHPNCRCI